MPNPKEWKNKEIALRCLRLGSSLEGIGSYEGYTLFIDGALPQEELRVRIERCEKRYGYAKLLEVKQVSAARTEPVCEHYAHCGGCSAQHMEYDYQLAAKSEMVADYFYKNAKLELQVPKTLGAKNPWHSRNKTSLPVREKNGEVQIGFYRKRSHNIVDVRHCPIASVQMDTILALLRRWMADHSIKAYNEQLHSGTLRHIVVRNNVHQELMVVLVTNGPDLPAADALISVLRAEVPGFVSLYQNINTQPNNVILGQQNRLLYGKMVLEQPLCGLCFEISPLSFLQVNTELTETLYQTAIQMARISKEDLVIDAYAGAGTISLIVAQYAKSVIGIELIPDAVENAKYNALKNSISNAAFLCGKVEEELPRLVREGISPTVLVLDPPRKGIEPNVLAAIRESLPQKILYISCNPATQARDVSAMLPLGYTLQAIQPVDMFCMSSEVETVALLSKLDVDKHIDVEIKLDELDLTSAESKATYAQIKEYKKNLV